MDTKEEERLEIKIEMGVEIMKRKPKEMKTITINEGGEMSGSGR